jgi:hypothetical protein
MAKMISFFVVAFLAVSIWGAVMQSGGGIAVAELSSNITSSAVSIPVNSTTNFISLDVITIGDEDILYSSKDATHFYVATGGRGYNGTSAKSHAATAHVYTQQAGFFNQMSNYNIGKIVDATGIWAVVNIPIAIFRLLINVVASPFGFLGEDLAIVTYVWMGLGIGLLVTVGIYLAGGRRVG